jgi:murein DD-endopeptidase MepM/ murein hydrolase activator NlpD
MGVVGQQANTIVELNQLNFSDEWVRLGLFELDGEHQFSGMVTLNNLTGNEPAGETQIAFGPVRWRKIERTGVPPGFADGFDSPVGTEAERRSEKIWPGQWVDANPYLNYYFLGYHTGNDLNLPRDEDSGAPCYSIGDGEVTYSGRAVNRDGSPSGFGNLVVIRHDPYLAPDGSIINAHSRYAHMKDLIVEKGQRVRRGDKLATIWNVGTRAHHLHFDISTSGILESAPGNWPGNRKSQVEKHYVDPGIFIKSYRPLF